MPIRTGKDARHQPAAKETQKPKKEQQAGQEADTGYGYAEENQKSSSSNPQGYSNSLDMEEESSFDPSADTTKIKILAGIVAVVVVALALLIIMLIKPGGIQDNTGVDVSGETAAPVVTPEAGTSFVQGDNNYADSENNQPAGTFSSPAEYVKGLEGEEVPVNYSVQSRQYVTAHVSYVAKRAVIDDGMEMYWIDVTYRKKKYRLQVPFYYFKDFEEEGICRVEIEVLDLENGSQIISYMHVIDEDTE